MCGFYLITIFAFITCSVSAQNVVATAKEDASEILDECYQRPFHRPHQHQLRGPEDDVADRPVNLPPPLPPLMCCNLPNIMVSNHEVFDKCHRMVHEILSPNQHHHIRHGGLRGVHERNSGRDDEELMVIESLRVNPRFPRASVLSEDTEDVAQPNGTSRADKFQERKECFMNCVFNVSGYILSDNMLNEDLLNQKLTEVVANDTKWAHIGESVFKKCIAAAKEANSQSQKTCKPGAGEYMKCMTREMFFNCPSDLWMNSSECTELKNRLEKCPNLMPPHHPHHRHHQVKTPPSPQQAANSINVPGITK